MFCRFCGRKISDDSIFCPFCGRNIEEKSAFLEANNLEKRKPSINAIDNSADCQAKECKQKTKNLNPVDFEEVAVFLSLALFILFVVLYSKIDPCFWRGGYFFYILTIVISIICWLLLIGSKSSKKIICMVAVPLVLVIATLILRGVYSAKYDLALNNIPNSGYARIHTEIEDKYYNSTGTGYVNDPHVHLSVDGNDAINGYLKIPINQNCTLKTNVSYYSEDTGKVNSCEYTTLNLSNNDLKIGSVISVEVKTVADQSCIATIRITYVVNPWDVIFW